MTTIPKKIYSRPIRSSGNSCSGACLKNKALANSLDDQDLLLELGMLGPNAGSEQFGKKNLKSRK